MLNATFVILACSSLNDSCLVSDTFSFRHFGFPKIFWNYFRLGMCESPVIALQKVLWQEQLRCIEHYNKIVSM